MIEVALSQSGSLYSREPRMWCRAKGWCGFGKGGAQGGQSLSLATDKAERILNILESQSKTIYDRSSLVAIQLPLAREPSVIVQG